jgi:hypothetical protein
MKNLWDPKKKRKKKSLKSCKRAARLRTALRLMTWTPLEVGHKLLREFGKE